MRANLGPGRGTDPEQGRRSRSGGGPSPTPEPNPALNPLQRWLLRRLLGDDDARVLLSELREQYEHRLEVEGAASARKAFRRDARRALGLAFLARIRSEPSSPKPRTIQSSHLHPRPAVMDNLLQDLRFGARSLLRRPLFTTIAILTLGLGIGSATAVFSVVEGVLLRPLPFSRPQELVAVCQTIPGWLNNEALADLWDRVPFNQPAFQRVREGQSSFTEIAAFRLATGTLVEEDQVTIVSMGVGSSSLFSVLGIMPVLGRTFLPEEDGPAASRVTLISQEIWQERFGSDPDILGRQVDLNGERFTIVGVLPAGFRLRHFAGLSSGSSRGFSMGFWSPLGLEADNFRHGNDSYQGIARLRPGVAKSRAEEEATRLIQSDPRATSYEARVWGLAEEWSGAYRRPLGLLMGAVLILLLIACGNVAALLLGEAPGRQREMTTRMALGAGKRRIGQQLLTECLLLGAAGSTLGVSVAIFFSRLLLRLAPPIPRLDEVAVNGWVLLFALAAGVLTSLAFGLAPAFHAAKNRIGGILAGGSRVAGGRSPLFHRGVVSGEIALTVLLLVGGGLLVRSLFTLLDVDTGFRQEGLVEARVFLPTHITAGPEEQSLIYRRMVDELERIPGVEQVSGTNAVPFSGSMTQYAITIFGASGVDRVLAQRRSAQTGFFRTMGIPVLRGREFTEADRQGTPRVAVISELMAERAWPGQDPIGARFKTMGDTVEVVGVVGDVRHASLTADPRPTVYVAAAQQTTPSNWSLILRTAQDPEPLLPLIRNAIRNVHPTAPITRLEAAHSLVLESVRDERFRTTLFLAFGAVAVLLAGAGVFGVTARGVEARKGELGVRMALGAQDGHLMRITLVPGLNAGLAGLAVGLAAALGASRVLAAFLFGVETWDPTTYGIVALTVLGVSLAATYLPSRRIRRLDPAEVLRQE